MATKKSTPATKATRNKKAHAGIEQPATNAALGPVEQDVKPDMPAAASGRKTKATAKPVGSEGTGKSETKMFEVRKTEPRAHVVPINLEDEIRRRAYELSQQREPWSGSEAEDWLRAEREVLQRYQQQSA